MNDTKPLGFAALWLGSQQNVSQGGHVHRMLVKFEEQDKAIAVLGGSWSPDRPVEVGIAPIPPVGPPWEEDAK